MIIYAAGVNIAAGYVQILAYESDESWPEGKLTYQNMFGNHTMAPMIESTNKEDIIAWAEDFINNENYDYVIYDDSDIILGH